jgi:pSer/pThr/pTyr-binding forkhead associated (FHA) protein
MDNTIIVSLISGGALLTTNFITAILTSRFTSKREQKKHDIDFKKSIAELVIKNPQMLLQIEKKLAIGILMIQNEGIRDRRYIIPNNRIQIGRYETCDIILDNPYISNEHCAIFTDLSRVYVEDLISKNGTYVNGKRVNSIIELTDGDEITIENKIIVYQRLRNPLL